MRVTITFRTMSGPAQVESLVLRVDTEDVLEAITRALAFQRSLTLTTIEIESIYCWRADVVYWR